MKKVDEKFQKWLSPNRSRIALRDANNERKTYEDMEDALFQAFLGGWEAAKVEFYFMKGNEEDDGDDDENL